MQKNCPKCRNKELKLNGKNPKGIQKYRCKKCNYSFINKDRKTPIIKTEKIFLDWLNEGYSSRQLGLQKSKNTLDVLKYIREKLDNNLIFQIDIVFENVEYIMIDGTWITSEICLIIYYDYINKKVIRFGFYDGEKHEYIKKGLEILKNEFKYEIRGFVLDGAKQIKKAIEEIYPTAKIQRCLTHIQRQIKNYISNNPKSDYGKDSQKIITFEKFKNKEKFLKEFNLWEKKYFDFLKGKSTNGTNSWYTHRKLRLARSHIENAISYMFYFLEDENIKKSFNDLEGYNGVLKGHIFSHRGLKIDRLISFISL